MKWMDEMEAKAKSLDGVTDRGKASQQKVMEEFFSAAIWPYPCPFPEIYCITAIKAQAAGAVPVGSTTAALDETIQFGHKQEFGEFDDADLAKYKESLIWWLQHPEEQNKIRTEMQAWARTKSWQAVAEQWNGEFK
jgi:glycosyltransferase involved in cell wall biosynthesis